MANAGPGTNGSQVVPHDHPPTAADPSDVTQRLACSADRARSRLARGVLDAWVSQKRGPARRGVTERRACAVPERAPFSIVLRSGACAGPERRR